MFKIRDAILSLGRINDPASNWAGSGNFRFANPRLISRDSEAMMFDIHIDSEHSGHFSKDARVIVRSVIGDMLTTDGKYRAFNMNLDWFGDVPLATYQPDSCFVELKQHHFDDSLTSADLYCGGFGGWQHASDFLADHFDLPFKYLWSIDRDSIATRCHCQNFGGTLFSEEVVEHYPLPKNEKLVICGSCDFVFLNRVNFQVPTRGATASFPCPPWSRGSKGKGFEYQDGGLAILEILRAGIVNNWEFILLENVDAIVEHFHYSWIRTYIDDAGYYIAFSNVSCIGDIIAAKRKRWVCVLVQKHLRCRIPQQAFDWSVPTTPTLRSSKIMPSCLPEVHERDLTLSNELLNIYGNPVFAPPGLKTRFTIDKRIKHGYEQMSTAMATYGRQHELPEDVIRTEIHSAGKGIYADLVQGNFGPRFWSPVEIAMTMIIFKRTHFPMIPSDSLRLTGNAISTLHAIKAIYALCTGILSKTIPRFEDVFHVALAKRLHMENSRIFIMNDWIIVEPLDFNIRDIEISLTLPMVRTIAITCDDQKKMIEIPCECTVIDLLTDQQISAEDVFISWKPAFVRARTSDHAIPTVVDEIFITKKYQVCRNLISPDQVFVDECIRQLKICSSEIETIHERVFFPIRIYQNERFCMTVHVWACMKVHTIAEICGKAVVQWGAKMSSIRLVPLLSSVQTNVGWWHLSGQEPCEIHVVTKRHREPQSSSILVWDDSRKSPLLGERIGEASHPGPYCPVTLEFIFGDRRCCVAKKDIGNRISKFDISSRLGVNPNLTMLWDPIQHCVLNWDEIDMCLSTFCYVKSLDWKVPQKKEKAISFWDFLPTELPKIKECKIGRNEDFSFGTIHRMTKSEIFHEQFEKILQEMNENFSKTRDPKVRSSISYCAKTPAEDLIWNVQNQTCDNKEMMHPKEKDQNIEPEYYVSEQQTEPKHAVGENMRSCKKRFQNNHVVFWIHLPIGRQCAFVSATGCQNMADLVKQAFVQANVQNHDYIMSGCYCIVNSKSCDFQMPVNEIPGQVIRVRLRGLLGGGKEDIQRACKAKLGEVLIHKGLPINAVAAKVQKIIDKLGLSQVHQVMQNQSEIHAWRQLEQLAQATDFVIFNEKELKSLSATLIQRAVKKKKKANMNSSIVVDHFTLPQGNFINEDKSETPCISIDKLRAGAHGIILATEEKILPWIQNGNKSSADELGVIFLGNPTTAINDVYQPTPISFAAMNQEGKECILRGALLQLGAKKVSLNQHFKIEGANAAMTTCSLTAYASDFTAESFATLISSPAKHMLAQLPNETVRNAISSVWGRSFMKDGKRVANLEADSVQLHLSIKTDKIVELLRCSGTCNIYITPKTESGLFDPKYHLIWTDLSKIAIEQKANEIQNHLGYIKGRKGFALRFLTTDAADGFKNLFPHKTFEPPVSVNALYRLQPVPFGILPEVLTEACKAIKWNIKPIKRSGNSWLVGADKQSPNKFLIIDGTTILVKEVEKANNGKSSIFLAGPRPKPTGKDRGVDPLQNVDPWASFRPTGAVSSQSFATLQPTMQTAQAPQAQGVTRNVTGPVEDRFKSQETRIQKLEQKLDDTMQQMQSFKQDTVHEFQKHQKEIGDMKDAFKSELIGLQKGITLSFQDSLKQAIQQQTQDMKKMFLESPTGVSPHKKQPKLGGDGMDEF